MILTSHSHSHSHSYLIPVTHASAQARTRPLSNLELHTVGHLTNQQSRQIKSLPALPSLPPFCPVLPCPARLIRLGLPGSGRTAASAYFPPRRLLTGDCALRLRLGLLTLGMSALTRDMDSSFGRRKHAASQTRIRAPAFRPSVRPMTSTSRLYPALPRGCAGCAQDIPPRYRSGLWTRARRRRRLDW